MFYTSEPTLAKMRPVMQRLYPLITFIADCVQPQWRNVLTLYPPLQVTPPPLNPELHAVAFNSKGFMAPLPPYRVIAECSLDKNAWAGRDPRRVSEQEMYECDECGHRQLEESEIKSETCCKCAGDALTSPRPQRVFICETPGTGFGIRALNVSDIRNFVTLLKINSTGKAEIPSENSSES